MTEPVPAHHGPPYCKVRIGRGVGIVHPPTFVLLDVANTGLGERIWNLVHDGAGIDELLEELSMVGLRRLGEFAMATVEAGAVRIVLRGAAEAVIDHGGRRETVQASTVKTWVERTFEEVDACSIGFGACTDDPPFRVAAGLVPADQLSWEPTGAATLTLADHATHVEEAVAAQAAVTAAPVAAPADDLDLDVDLGRTVPPPLVGTDVGTEEDDGDDEDDEGYDYDSLYAHTRAKTVQGAAVTPAPDDVIAAVPAPAGSMPPPPPTASPVPVAPAPAPLGPPSPEPRGDHDGLTVSRAHLQALRSAAPSAPSSPPAADGLQPPQVQALLCPQGHANPPNALACRRCGADRFGPPVYVGRPLLGRLRLDTGAAIELDRPVLLGRNPRLEGRLPVEIPRLERLEVGAGLSRSHALIRLEGWHVLLEDLNSSNGTVVTLPGAPPQRLRANEPILLRDGALVDLGGEITAVYEEAR